jgi:hypothetical protein
MKKTRQNIVPFQNSILLLFLLLILPISNCSNSYVANRYFPDAKSPEQVVELFQKTFGTPRMDEIGPYTTENFRDNQPITVWISKTWEQLNIFEYEKVDFKLLGIEYNDTKNFAKITGAAKIKSAAATVTQKELYLLKKEGDFWLIDELKVTEEEIKEEEVHGM